MSKPRLNVEKKDLAPDETKANRLIKAELTTAQVLLWDNQEPETQAIFLLHVQIGNDLKQLATLPPEQQTKIERYFQERAYLTYGLAAKQIVTALLFHPAGVTAKTIELFLKLQKSELPQLAELLMILQNYDIISGVRSADGKTRFVLTQTR